jgi:leader peptidase (prepilin peptidase)/N-methyltransferase
LTNEVAGTIIWKRKVDLFKEHEGRENMNADLVIAYCAFLLFAVPISICDIREFRIPDLLSLGGLVVLSALKLIFRQSPLDLIALQCALGFGSFWLVNRLSGGRLGLGDAKYSALIAVAVGILPWFVALLAASVTGLIYAAIMVLFFNGNRRSRIPFAPFLTLGAALSVVAGPVLQRL